MPKITAETVGGTLAFEVEKGRSSAADFARACKRRAGTVPCATLVTRIGETATCSEGSADVGCAHDAVPTSPRAGVGVGEVGADTARAAALVEGAFARARAVFVAGVGKVPARAEASAHRRLTLDAVLIASAALGVESLDGEARARAEESDQSNPDRASDLGGESRQCFTALPMLEKRTREFPVGHRTLVLAPCQHGGT